MDLLLEFIKKIFRKIMNTFKKNELKDSKYTPNLFETTSLEAYQLNLILQAIDEHRIDVFLEGREKSYKLLYLAKIINKELCDFYKVKFDIENDIEIFTGETENSYYSPIENVIVIKKSKLLYKNDLIITLAEEITHAIREKYCHKSCHEVQEFFARISERIVEKETELLDEKYVPRNFSKMDKSDISKREKNIENNYKLLEKDLSSDFEDQLTIEIAKLVIESTIKTKNKSFKQHHIGYSVAEKISWNKVLEIKEKMMKVLDTEIIKIMKEVDPTLEIKPGSFFYSILFVSIKICIQVIQKVHQYG